MSSHLSFMVTDGGVHLLLIDDLDLGGGTAQDTFLLLLGQLVRHHLDRFHPFVPVTVATDIQTFKHCEGKIPSFLSVTFET